MFPGKGGGKVVMMLWRGRGRKRRKGGKGKVKAAPSTTTTTIREFQQEGEGDRDLPPSNNPRPLQLQHTPPLNNKMLPLPIRPRIPPIRQTHHMHRVRHQHQPSRMRPPRDLDRRRVQVDPIRDQPKVRPLLTTTPAAVALLLLVVRLGNAQNTKDTGVPMMQRAHRIKQMRDHRRARGNRRTSLLIRRLGVPNRHQNPPRSQRRDQLRHGPQLRGRGDHLDGHGDRLGAVVVRDGGAGREVGRAVHVFEVRKGGGDAQDRGVVHAVFCWVEEGPLDVRAEGFGAVVRQAGGA